MRVAVVDLGTNSTRLLVAEVAADGAITELAREARVTRLGAGVDATGALAADAQERVFAVVSDYIEQIDALGAERRVAVLTSAVRDASNGAVFAATVRDRFGLDARTIAGEEEARLTFLGALSEHDAASRDERTLVVDIGGGSTELVVGRGRTVEFFASTQAGVVRHAERHLRTDPPTPGELEALAEDARAVFEQSTTPAARDGATTAIAVAGTPASLAAIDLELVPYDADAVHGHVLTLRRIEQIADRVAALDEQQRRALPGLHPDRAPTIVAGAVLLIEVLRTFGLDAVEVSEHDILRGAALQAADATLERPLD